MDAEMEKFSAMFISAKPVYGDNKFIFLRDHIGWECTFRYYPHGPRLTFRVQKENPLAGGLQPTRIYHFRSINDPAEARKPDVVTELRTARTYEMKD